MSRRAVTWSTGSLHPSRYRSMRYRSFVEPFPTLPRIRTVPVGGQFALTVRRGSNDWHGLAYDYYQNAALNANSWSNNRTAAARPGLISNRFGGTFGGPFWKDRAYFFLAYEGYRFPNSANVTELGITETHAKRDPALQRCGGKSEFLTTSIRRMARCLRPAGRQETRLRSARSRPEPNHQTIFQLLPCGQQPDGRRWRHQHSGDSGAGFDPGPH